MPCHPTTHRRSAQLLLDLLKVKSVVKFQDILAALNDASSATAFRYLQQVPYRSSYNHNGRYYAIYEPSRYDRFGLFHHGDIYFSRDGTLKATVRRLILESEAGFTQREMQELLRVRVQSCLQRFFSRSRKLNVRDWRVSIITFMQILKQIRFRCNVALSASRL